MVTVHTARYMGGKKYIEGECLSTDIKPTDNIMNGSKLNEMDTSSTYAYDEANGIWWEIERNSGGGGGGGGGDYDIWNGGSY